MCSAHKPLSLELNFMQVQNDGSKIGQSYSTLIEKSWKIGVGSKNKYITNLVYLNTFCDALTAQCE